MALVDVLRSEFDMPHIFRLVLADMLETGGVRSSIEPAWTIQVVKRRDSKQTKSRLAVYAACKEVQGLVDQGDRRRQPVARLLAALLGNRSEVSK